MDTEKQLPPPYTAQPMPGIHQFQNQPSAPPPEYTPHYTPQYAPQTYGATHTTVVIPEPQVIIVGACPACRIGVLEDDFTCLGLMCAIVFFPVGILCCLLLKEKKCSNCRATFD